MRCWNLVSWFGHAVFLSIIVRVHFIFHFWDRLDSNPSDCFSQLKDHRKQILEVSDRFTKRTPRYKASLFTPLRALLSHCRHSYLFRRKPYDHTENSSSDRINALLFCTQSQVERANWIKTCWCCVLLSHYEASLDGTMIFMTSSHTHQAHRVDIIGEARRKARRTLPFLDNLEEKEAVFYETAVKSIT